MCSRAFVLEPCNLDVSGAEVFGDVTYVFDVGSKRHSIWSEEYAVDVVSAMRRHEFDADEDYFVVAGHMVSVVRAIDALVREYGFIQSLMFSATDRHYIARRLGNGQSSCTAVPGGAVCSCSGLCRSAKPSR